MASTIGKVNCTACGGSAHVNEGKGGTLSISCQASDCKALTMVKSPNAVAALRAKLAGAAPGPVVVASSSLSDFLGEKK